MNLVNFLVELLKISGLIFLIGIVFDLILDVVIITPIQTRRLENKKLKMFDILIQKLENGEDISEKDLEEITKEIEN